MRRFIGGPLFATESELQARIRKVIPDLEACIDGGMKAYDVPGLAIGIVAGDKLIYANGFGVTGKTRKAIGGANVSLAGDAYVVPRGLPISC